jgi:hypothetical protein
MLEHKRKKPAEKENLMKKLTVNAVVVLALVLLARGLPARAGEANRSPKQLRQSPVKVFILAGQSNMEGQGAVSAEDKDHRQLPGTLTSLLSDPAKAAPFKHLKNGKGEWTVREDVWVYSQTGTGVAKGGLTLGYGWAAGNKNIFGPELQFGHVMGNYLTNQVLIIKTAWGGKSLYKDFRPPSSGGEVGPCYTKMLETVVTPRTPCRSMRKISQTSSRTCGRTSRRPDFPC